MWRIEGTVGDGPHPDARFAGTRPLRGHPSSPNPGRRGADLRLVSLGSNGDSLKRGQMEVALSQYRENGCPNRARRLRKEVVEVLKGYVPSQVWCKCPIGQGTEVGTAGM